MRIEEGSYVLLRLPSGNTKVVKLEKDQIVNLGKFGTFSAEHIIGDPFGFTYEVLPDKSVTKVEQPEYVEHDDLLGTEQSMEGDRIDSTGLQALTTEEIESLKKQGLSGEEIIAKVQKGHAAFEHKTEYSKEKYMKRKKRKFLQQFTPEAFGPHELVEYYIEKDHSKVLNMSPETLSLLLNSANIFAGGNYLVLDETPGVIVGAILSRIGEEGSVTVLHENEHPNLDALRFLGLDKSPLVRTLSLLDFLHPDEAPKFEEKSSEELSPLKPVQRGQYFRNMKRENDRKWIIEKARSEEGFDALVVASTLDLQTLIPSLLPALGGSCPLAIYSEYKEPLVSLTLMLKKDLRVLGPTTTETRVRKYQTLPGRIHPEMSMRGYGGYILSALRVFPDSAVSAKGAVHSRPRKRIATGLETRRDESMNEIE